MLSHHSCSIVILSSGQKYFPVIQVLDKTFVPFISAEQIAARIAVLGAEISRDYSGKNPLFIAILNGSFIFAADLFRAVTVDADISFIKLASYKGTSSIGHVITAIGLEEQLAGRHVVIVEDIVDTGKTLSAFLPEIRQRQPASVKIAAFVTKPDAQQHNIHADYTGFEIPDRFVIGYGWIMTGKAGT